MSDNSLSWGRTPPRPRRTRWRLIAVAAVALILAIVIGGQIRQRIQEPSEEETAIQIAAVLNEYIVALRLHDLDRFQATIDTARPLFARCQDEIFQTYARTLRQPAYSFPVGKIEKYRGYLRAYAYWAGGWERLYFRRDDAGWKRSEPLIEEVGSSETRTYGTMPLEYWDIDADIADIVGNALADIRAFAVAQGGPPPENDFSVRVAPVEGLGPRCGIAGQAQSSTIRSRTTIVIRDPLFAAGYAALADPTIATLEHEAMHWVQREYSRDALGAMPWWMIEGWPEARAQRPLASEVTRAYCSDPRLDESDLARGPRTTDGLDTAARYYRIAAGMVAELDRQYGTEAYWTVVGAFRTDPHPAAAFATIGTNAESFFATFAQHARGGRC
jgi:hypothetical protein